MSDTVTTLTRKTFNANMENVLCNGTRYADLAPDTRNLLWAAYNLTGDQGTMPVDQWAAVFVPDAMDSITTPDTQPDDFRSECREWLAKRVAANQAAAKAPETASPVEASPSPASAPPAPETTEEDKGKAKQAWEQYVSAVAGYSKAKAFLLVGKWGQKYTQAKVKPLTDAGEKRSMRARCIERCQRELDDNLDSATFKVDAAIRAWGVASVYGEEDAMSLPRGKVEAFVPTIARDKAEESWSLDASIPAEQQTALRSLWAELVKGLDLNADQAKARVKAILKPATQETTQASTGTTQTTQGEQKPASSDSAAAKDQNQASNGQASNKPAESSKPQGAVAPKQSADLAEHFFACLKDRTDSAAVWQAFGKLMLPSKADMEGFIHGLLAQGPKQATVDTLRALLSAAGNAISTLARQARDASKPQQSAAA